ncbi:VCBS domain-containing protein [Vibrio ruber]|uniref:VCBS domain-containing protein n=5 Tax=Vibrio ruber TaxID=184755 RepID=UPI0021C3F6A7|nr:VCBS domain-containing protein [Vibrio ruber]
MRFESKISLPDVAKDQVIIIDQDGNVITIKPGEIIPPGVVILEGGNFLNHDDYTALNAKVVTPNGDKVDITDDVNQLLTAIEQGNDPTQLGEEFAPAAGNSSAGSSLSTSATVEAVNDELIAQTDFSTQGLYRFSSLSLSDTQGLALLDVFNTLSSSASASTNTADSAPIVSGTFTGDVTEGDIGDVVQTSGSLSISDADPNDNPVFADTTLDGTYGSLSLVNGQWTYTLDQSRVQDLSEGEKVSDTITITASDGTTQNIVINIVGTNDAPVVQAATGSVDEDATITGSVTATDVDLPSGQALVFTTDSTVPGLTLNADGSYRFDASSYDHLSAGETQVIEIPVTVLDERGATATTTLTVTVTGTNDAPVAQAATASVTEDATVTGNITATDVDLPAGQALVFTTDSTVPGLTLNADGSYRFDASSYDHLSAGETQVIEIPVTVLDERGATATTTLTVTVTGTNDAPVAQAATGSVTEDATVTGNITATDVDLPAGQALVFTTDSTVPGLTLNADGSYRFDASSYDHLSAGETQVIEIPVTVLDERGATATTTLTVTVTGTNDAPVAQAATASVTEDATVTGNITATDVDLPTGQALVFTTDSTVPGLTLNADGSYSFDASGYDALSAGETQVIEVPVTVTDEQGATATTTLTITVTGTNDAPIAQAATASVTEDATVTGSIAATDVDLPADASLTFSTESTVDGLTLNADGSYSFDASGYDALGEGEQQIIEVPVTVTDDQGATATTTLTITVTGTNDAPVAQAATASVTEDATVTGNITATDVDLPADASLTFSTDSTVDGLTLNADGSYSFDASGYDALNAGETQVIEVPVTVTDDQGATATTTLTITVTGTNDAPVAQAATASVTEDATVTGNITATDVDLPADASLTFSTDSTVDGLTLNADGSYSFDASGYDALSAGETQVIEVPVTVTDDQGATATTTLTITVTGTNDAPVAQAATASVTEDATVSGSITATDVDLPADASLTFSTESTVDGLTLNVDGSYSFDASGYDALSAGETQVIEVPVTVTDDQGATTSTTLTITVTGTNDAPVAQAATASVTEDATVSGSITATDVDLPDDATLTFSTDSTVDGLTLNADGSYSFDASGYDALSAGETQVIEVPVTVTDDQGATATTTLTITVTGTNDAPVAQAATASVTEDATITGSVTATDVDLPADASLTFSTDATVDGLTLNADGSYSFDASGYDALSAGETQVIKVPVTVTDDQGATATTTLTITVTGTNDAPVAQAATASVTEDATVSGSITATDVDLPADASLTFSTDSTVDGLTLNADGSYSFDASGYDALSAGETQVIEVPVTVTDDQGATATTTLTITVTGTNDAPVAQAATHTVTEDATVSGSITATDVDLPADASLSFSTESTVDGLTLNADGSYSFDASGYDALSAGETQVIEVPVTVTDDQGATTSTTLTITVTGTNDAPVAQAATHTVTEDATVSGSITATDVDLPADATLTFSTESTVDGLTLNADGSYSFDASGYDALSAGETQVIEVPVTVTDDQGATTSTTLTITVTGTNDAPVAQAATVSVTEDATITGSVTATDVDLPADASLTFSTESTVDGLTLNADGSYSFDASGYDALSAGETQVIEVPVTVTDDQGATATTTLTITVTGTNDAPVAQAATASVTEDATVTGSITATDVDLPADATLTFSTESTVDGLTLNADGSYSFDASGYDALSAGETQVIEVPVTVTDDQGATATTTLTITVTGTNDAPVAQAATNTVTEDATVTGNITATDVDLPADASLTFSTDATVDGLILNADGSYSFDASGYDALSAGETQVIEVPVTVTDDQGATATTTLTITVTGTNDAPVAQAATASVTEDATVSGNITATDVDLPADASLTFSTDSTVDGLTLNADGSYSFDASGYDALSAGETQVIEVPVTVTDDQGATATTTLTITVTGTNDAPVAQAATASVTEDATVSGSITATDVDLPADATLTFSTDATVDGLTLNADGSYSFDASGYDALSAGETQVIEVPVTVTDDQGATATTTLTITVTGTNDAPVAQAATASVTEDATVSGSITATDVDLPADASLSFSTDSTVDGLTLNADGSYSFDASGYDALSAGETQVIEVPVTVTDDQGATATTTLTITVTGTNDAPVAQAATASVTEDATVSGSITATDVDLPADATLTFSTESTVDGLTLNADGSYSFDASGYDALSAGETQVIEVPVTVTDDQGATTSTTLTITVTGTNDAPVAQAATVSVTEDATITGSVTATDVDLPADASLTFSTESTVDGLTLNADGSYSFDASGYDALSAGETQVIEVPVTVTDDQGATATTTLTITVTGTNDAPVAQAATASVTEDATVTGSITATDVDLPADATLTFSTESTVDGLTLNADGSYSFDASGYDALSAGETQVIEVPVTVTDDQGATATTTLTITVTGTNDAPVAQAATNTVTEDATVTGNITATDVDLPADASLTFSTDATVDGLILNADGSYSFDASGYDALSAGETQVIEVPVTVTDDQGATATTTLTITVTGTNDAPVAQAATASVTEDATVSGNITATDVDLPADASLTFSTDSTVDGLTLNADGSYSFDASGYDALSAGETQVIEVPVTVTDDQGATATTTLTITVTGTNDAPVAQAATASVTEDATITGSVTATDVDLPADATLTFSTDATVDGLTLNADGSYSFDTSGYDALSAGETQVIEVPVTVTDDQGATATTTLTITVTGTNDAPVAQAATASVTEDATVSGSITATDVDLPADATLTFSTDSTVDGLTLNADGSYSFDASGYDALSAGETQVIEVPVTVTDDQGATTSTTLTITVTGTNDAPMAQAATASVTEDATVTGSITATDVDLPADATLTFSTESTVDGLTLNADGSYSFDASGYDALSAGETQVIEVPVTVTDDQGATATTTLTITVTGTNDAPVAQAATASVTEDATITGSVTATDVDLPADASLTFSTESTVDGLTLNVDGSYSFDASGYDALSAGETQVIEVPVTVTDDQGATATTTLTITVTGTNDAPVAQAATASVTEDATVSGSITATDVDLPADASLTFSTESTVDGLTLNADGSYSFDASGYDALSAGETQVIEVPVTVTDDQGATATTTLTITVTGTNDAPVAQAATASVTEDATVSGNITATDVDLPADASLSFSTESTVDGLTLNADGSYSFDASGYDALGAGQQQVIEVPITVTDDRGATDTTTLTITVVGSNDAPVAQAAVGIVAEDARITGNITATDVDLPADATLTFSTDSTVDGLTLNADGSYSFDASGYDALSAGETQVIEVPVTVTDDQGATATTTLTITVVGTNDAPVAQAAVGIVAEDARITGNITATDVDLPADATLTFSTDSTVDGLTLNADGSYSFDASGYDALGAGQQQVIEVPITVTDDRGATDTTTLTITVVGTNDAPVAQAAVGIVAEDARITGNITATDVDLPADATLTFSTDSTVDGLTLNADGSYSFDASGYDALGAGQQQVIEVPITVTDDRGATDTTTLTITVVGTNDAPVAQAAVGIVAEDARITGNITATDVDLPADATLTFSTDSTVDGLTLNADGSYSFDASGYDALSAGETQVIEVPVTVTDDQGATDTTTLTITVVGSNDAPVAQAAVGIVAEDARITGNITATDVDLPADATLTFSTDSTVDGLTLNADGSYSFDASGYDALGAGQQQVIEVPITVTDDRGATDTTTLTITVVGTNDAPVAQAAVGIVAEDARITGNITATDVDLPADATLTFSTDSTVDGLTLNADGSYSFDASGYDALGAGQQQVIEVPITVTDDRGATDTTTLTITVVGSNDAPVAQAAVGIVAEDARITGNITATDVDLPADATLTFSTESTVDGLTLNADGSYSFDASGYDALGAGQQQVIEVPITVTDDRGATDTTTLTITVVGTNDAPVAQAAVGIVAEDARITGNITATDVDLPVDARLTFSTESTVDGLTLNADGSYSFDASGYDALGAGQQQVIEVPITVTDDRGATDTTTLTITVVGSNDAPVAQAAVGIVAEDARITGNITATDVDLPADATLTFSTESTVDGLTLNADGSYSFDASGYDALGAGQQQVIEVPITVTDDRGATDTTTLTITVVGSNDAPVAQAAVGIVAEDARITGNITATDVDLPADATLTFSTDSTVDGLTLNADGSYSFDASGYDALGAGQQQVIEVPITVTDDRGATANTTLTITVTGTNDAPVIALEDSAKQVSISEEGLAHGNPDTTGSHDTTNARQASGSFSVSDPDSSSVTMSLVAPTTPLYSHGIAIIWALLEDGSLVGQANGETVMTISLSDEGNGDYSYTVHMQGSVDHPDSSGEDALQVEFGISANDGQTVSTQSVLVSIEDDSPDSHTTNVVVEADDTPFNFSVTGTTVTLGNSVFDNGDWHTQQTDTRVAWGTSGAWDTSYSSYQVSPAQQGPNGYTEGQPFELATLVHQNGSVLSYESTLDSTVLTIVTQVTINGVAQSVTLHLNVDHDETSNNSQVDGDSITLTTDYVDVEIDGVMYRLDIEGFKKEDGTISKTVVTPEGDTETYTLVASLNYHPDSHPDQVVTGTIDYDAGADGMASVEWEAGTEHNGATVIHGEYGTLTVYADGHYTYDVNEDALATLDEGTTATDSFNYVVTDNDGDSAASSLNFEVSGNSAPPLSTGLHGEFYNYQEGWSNHWNNVDSLADALAIIRNQDPNAEFTSTKVDYQSDLLAYNLGSYDTAYWLNGRTNLEEWLEDTGDDRSVIFNNKENSSDAVIRLTGGVALDSGTYSIKVTADDGYQIKINGVVVAEYDGIQSATTDTFTFTVDGSGYQTVEIVYWDQGGAHQLTVALADVTDGVTGDYSVLGSDAYPTVNGDVTAAGSVDVITDHEAMAASYEDRIAQFEAGDYWQIDGDHKDNHLVGSSGDDHIDGHGDDDWIDGGLGGADWLQGGHGDDTLVSSYGNEGDLLDGGDNGDHLYGRDGNDILIGGSGEDYLSGGAGNDILIGGSLDDHHADGSDLLIGGAGKDLFVLDSSSVDKIQDFHTGEDAIDLSNLLADVLDNQSNDAIQQYLDQNVEVTSEHGQTHLSINNVNVADFGHDSSFDANSAIAVIINDHEFSVKYHNS